MDGESIGSVLNKTHRLILGGFVLLLVDIIWVSSSELTKYIYVNEKFEKPFFCTYIQTSMFSLYLLGFCFWPPWRDYCQKPNNYTFIDPELEDEAYSEAYSEANTSLSNSTYVPVKTPDRETIERNSSTESDDSSIRSVRFNKLAEVRHMSEVEATEALLARLSYQASVRAGEIAKRAATKLPVYKVAKIAFVFCLLWFFANYTFQVALAHTESGMLTALSSMSSFFTLILASIFPSNINDKFSISKLVAVFLSILGVAMVTVSDLTIETELPWGVVLALISAFFYALYIVFLKREVDHEDKMDLPLFFGFVGVFNIILLWPLFFFLHFSQWEKFEWPSKHQFMFLLLNGLLGTVISEVLWLWGCFLTSSLMATMAITLTIPMNIMADIMMKKITYTCLFYIGIIPIILSVIGISLLSHYENWDPVLDSLRCAYQSIFRRNRMRFRFTDMQSEQTEALIGINSEHEA